MPFTVGSLLVVTNMDGTPTTTPSFYTASHKFGPYDTVVPLKGTVVTVTSIDRTRPHRTAECYEIGLFVPAVCKVVFVEVRSTPEDVIWCQDGMNSSFKLDVVGW